MAEGNGSSGEAIDSNVISMPNTNKNGRRLKLKCR